MCNFTTPLKNKERQGNVLQHSDFSFLSAHFPILSSVTWPTNCGSLSLLWKNTLPEQFQHLMCRDVLATLNALLIIIPHIWKKLLWKISWGVEMDLSNYGYFVFISPLLSTFFFFFPDTKMSRMKYVSTLHCKEPTFLSTVHRQKQVNN